MRPPLLMFEEKPEWDDLEVRVVVEVDGAEVEGRARGRVTDDSRIGIVAKAALEAARAVYGGNIGDYIGTTTGEVGGRHFVVSVIGDSSTGDPLVGSAPLRHFEDPAQAVIRSVFDAVNRRGAEPGTH
ncbi:MAG: hypothetical protein OEW30_20820 [Acidimicrobiia bacterium]|nr:hypothetical protein [Acidimicrobiia bacterium]